MGDAIEIRTLAANEADKLSACFRRCYGETYVAEFFYDPAAIAERLADGRLHSVVAVNADAEIVGHMALTSRHARALTTEAGNTIVDPRYRSQGLAARLGAALFEACREGGCVGFHHYPTTAHTIMQKLAVQGGGVETGVMLAYIPAETDYKDLSGTSAEGRLAVVVVYQPISPAPPRDVYLPKRFAPILEAIYERAGLARHYMHAGERPADTVSELRTMREARRGLLRIEVEWIGADLRKRVQTAMQEAADIVHVDLPLTDPATPHAVEVLRSIGFIYCALLPELTASDVLRLQYVRDRTALERPPALLFPEAREILRVALAERASA